VVKAVATRSIELESIDRLEEKIRLLVGVVERLRTDQARTSEENARLTRELEGARARLSAAEGSSAEITSLREERELIKSRVEEMLSQIESLNL
jgi:regulator of replication initiation timing